jgi:hypothetical protein
VRAVKRGAKGARTTSGKMKVIIDMKEPSEKVEVGLQQQSTHVWQTGRREATAFL